MDATKLSKRARQALADLQAEKPARGEAALTRMQSPEYRERERTDREVLDRDYRATGTIASTPVSQAVDEALQGFIRSVRRACANRRA